MSGDLARQTRNDSPDESRAEVPVQPAAEAEPLLPRVGEDRELDLTTALQDAIGFAGPRFTTPAGVRGLIAQYLTRDETALPENDAEVIKTLREGAPNQHLATAFIILLHGARNLALNAMPDHRVHHLQDATDAYLGALALVRLWLDDPCVGRKAIAQFRDTQLRKDYRALVAECGRVELGFREQLRDKNTGTTFSLGDVTDHAVVVLEPPNVMIHSYSAFRAQQKLLADDPEVAQHQVRDARFGDERALSPNDSIQAKFFSPINYPAGVPVQVEEVIAVVPEDPDGEEVLYKVKIGGPDVPYYYDVIAGVKHYKLDGQLVVENDGKGGPKVIGMPIPGTMDQQFFSAKPRDKLGPVRLEEARAAGDRISTSGMIVIRPLVHKDHKPFLVAAAGVIQAAKGDRGRLMTQLGDAVYTHKRGDIINAVGLLIERKVITGGEGEALHKTVTERVRLNPPPAEASNLDPSVFAELISKAFGGLDSRRSDDQPVTRMSYGGGGFGDLFPTRRAVVPEGSFRDVTASGRSTGEGFRRVEINYVLDPIPTPKNPARIVMVRMLVLGRENLEQKP